MEIAVAVVMSLDGKITRHEDSDFQEWASKEDQQFFYSLFARYDLVVMGLGTYEATRDNFVLGAERLRIVLTSKYKQYAHKNIPGKLDFRDQTPSQLVNSLDAAGKANMLVVGGPRMITEFIKSRLVDKLYVTVEPRLFGHGKSLLANTPLDIQLHLLEHKQLNSQGTILLTYGILQV